MQILGFTIQRTKTTALTKAVPASLSGVDSRGGWWPVIREYFPGAWQRNVELSNETVLAYAAVYACVTLIASDIGKLRWKLVTETSPGIWEETTNPAYSPVLRKPNHFQTHIQFKEQWITSKLIHGNAYALKQRDKRGVVEREYLLDPQRVRPLVASDGAVYYQLQSDNLSGLQEGVTVPASEIIHDVMVPLYHPLCGVSPITACGIAALQGLAIQNNSTRLFRRGMQPPGVLSVLTPGRLDDEEVKKIQASWDQLEAGQIAILGSDMKYQSLLGMNAVDAQLIEQLKWSAQEVCTAFKVPGHKIGVGSPPTFNNVEALDQQYYSQCLQTHIENMETLHDEGLSLAENLGTELDLEGLLRMDGAARVTAAKDSANGGGMTFNEARKRYHGLGPVPGGDVVLSQQQNFSLEALAKRDAREDPFATADAPARPTEPAPTMSPAGQKGYVFMKALERLRAAA